MMKVRMFDRLLVLALLTCGACSAPGFAARVVSEETAEPFPGIRIVERVTHSPPTRIFAAFISIAEPTLYVDATAPTRQLLTVEEWAKKQDALVAVNGDFLRYADGTPHVYGDAVGNGERWPEAQTGRGEHYAKEWFHGRYGWIAFGGNGVTFTPTRHTKQNMKPVSGWKPNEFTTEIPPNTRALVSGFSQLVIEGEPVTCDDPTAASCFPDRTDMRTRHPRTAMGLSKDQQTFILVVVDGRSKESVGMYGTELAALMKDFGAWNAINLDGGGSSQFYVKGRGTINAPSGAKPRKVLNHWGVFEKK